MLYDPKWEKPEVKADPYSLESLISWLEMQPANKTYCYLDNGKCLHCQYFGAMGFKNVYAFGHAIYHGEAPIHDDYSERDAIKDFGRLSDAFVEIAVSYPYTFGAALTRARKALADRR